MLVTAKYGNNLRHPMPKTAPSFTKVGAAGCLFNACVP